MSGCESWIAKGYAVELEDNAQRENLDALRRHPKGALSACEVPMRMTPKRGAFLKQVEGKLYAYLSEKLASSTGRFKLLFETGVLNVNVSDDLCECDGNRLVSDLSPIELAPSLLRSLP